MVFFSCFKLKSLNDNYLRGWRKTRQGLALGVWGRPLGLGLALRVGLGQGPDPKEGKPGPAKKGRMGRPGAQLKGKEGEGPGLTQE